MKTAMSAPAIWLVLTALADPVAAQVDIRSRFPVGDAIEAPKPQDLKVVTRVVPAATRLQQLNQSVFTFCSYPAIGSLAARSSANATRFPRRPGK